MKKIKVYVFTLLTLIFLFTAFTAFLYVLKPNFKVVSRSYNKDYIIYDYQLKKLEKSNDLNYVFIGDSSLGNAFNSKLFDNHTSSKSLNLALTDIYGFAGQYNLLKKIIKKNNKTLKKVFFVTSVFFPLSDYEDEAFFITSNNFKDFYYSKSKIDFIRQTYKYSIKSILINQNFNEKNQKKFVNKIIYKDYIKQDEKQNLKIKNIDFENNYKNKKYYLKKIIDLCENNNLDIIKLYGPLFINKPENIEPYINENKKIYNYINSKNFIIIDKVIRFDTMHLGDQLMHVRSEFKDYFTLKYIDLLKSEGLI